MGNEPPVLPLPGAASGRPLLVSDFDGTITRHDFYQLILDRLPPGSPDYWGEYRAGRMTSFEVLRAIFGAARWGEAELLGLIDAAEPDSNLAESVRKLRAAGWDLVIVSNGCDWYIRRLLAREGLSVEVLANPGRFEPGNGLVMTAPEGSRFFAPAVGIRKGLVVREALDSGRRVAFAGDGLLDAEAARLVEPRHRFARADLAALLRREGLPFRPFERWSEVVAALVAEPEPAA